MRKSNNTKRFVLVAVVLALVVAVAGLSACSNNGNNQGGVIPVPGSSSSVVHGDSNPGSNNDWKGMFLGWGKTLDNLSQERPDGGSSAWVDAAMYLRYGSANYTEFTPYMDSAGPRIPAGKLVISDNDSPDPSKLRVFLSSRTGKLADGSVVYLLYADDKHATITCDGTKINPPTFYYSPDRGVLSVAEYQALG